MAAILPAREASFFRQADNLATKKHLERLVSEGKIPQAALVAIEEAAEKLNSYGSTQPTVVGRHPSEYIYQHTKSQFPAPRVTSYGLGTQVSLGRARWTSDGASIFSVQDGKRLAQTPPKEPTIYEQARMARMARNQLETPLVRGYRLLPEFTPGRALMWGTIFAVWGSAALVVSTARQLGIHKVEDANDALRNVFSPFVAGATERLAPLQGTLSIPSPLREQEPSELAKKLRVQLGAPERSSS
ncbi:hypothetical protein WJX72_001239 [[Myrmecia] bisecta]|uniref:Uncharacterized protein n=1 Tax=[Myrmecia] bisecta TaxID=41462 RepID=A0AAW1QBG5_9CHLO